MNKVLQAHEIYDPTRVNSRLFKFILSEGETAFMQIFIVPKAGLGEAVPKKPTKNQVVQTITEAANTNIYSYIPPHNPLKNNAR